MKRHQIFDDKNQSLGDLSEFVLWLDQRKTTSLDVICVDAINMDRIALTPKYFQLFTHGRRHLNFEKLQFNGFLPKACSNEVIKYNTLCLQKFVNVVDYMQQAAAQVQKERICSIQAQQQIFRDHNAWLTYAFHRVCEQHANFKKALLFTRHARLINNDGLRLAALEQTRNDLKPRKKLN